MVLKFNNSASYSQLPFFKKRMLESIGLILLIVSSAISGKVESFKKIGDSINASPIINNGKLYILTKKSRIFGLS